MMWNAVIVAEGIENDAQNRLARELSCDEGQGWLFGRALPVETATELLYAKQSTPVLAIASG